MGQERYRKTIYCDWDFLTSLLSKQDNNSLLDKSLYIEQRIASQIKELILCSDIKLYINMPKDEFDKLHEDVYKKKKKAVIKGKEPQLNDLDSLILDIYMRQLSGELHLNFNSSKIKFDDSFIDTDNFLNALFFSSESKEVCKRAMENYGIMVLCAENIREFEYLTFDQGVAIMKGEENTWKECLKGIYSVPCNSLIIVDNYLLNDIERYDENLRRIFEVLLPMGLSDSLLFQITIFTTLCKDSGVHLPSKPRLEIVQSIINELRKNLKFNVSIIKCSKDKFHDRTIITNNLYVSCGGGFDLFNNSKAQKTTTISVLNPFFNTHTKWARKAYSDILQELNRVFRKTEVVDSPKIDDRYPNFALGEKENRLIMDYPN